jgi:Uma2 family endonuclease
MYQVGRRRRVREEDDMMTIEEYLQTPESVLPTELAYGALRVAEAPLVPHQRAVGQLFLALSQHVTAHALGEVWLSPIDVILDWDRHLVAQPDLLFISNARTGIVSDRICGAPDLVVEVLSPRPRVGTLNEHLEWFARYDVRECWVVDLTHRRLEVIAFDRGAIRNLVWFDDKTPIRSEVLTGFGPTLTSILVY